MHQELEGIQTYSPVGHAKTWNLWSSDRGILNPFHHLHFLSFSRTSLFQKSGPTFEKTYGQGFREQRGEINGQREIDTGLTRI